MKLKNYNRVYKLRNNRGGGGVIVYYKNKMVFNEITYSSKNFENVTGTLSYSNKNISIDLIAYIDLLI